MAGQKKTPRASKSPNNVSTDSPYSAQHRLLEKETFFVARRLLRAKTRLAVIQNELARAKAQSSDKEQVEAGNDTESEVANVEEVECEEFSLQGDRSEDMDAQVADGESAEVGDIDMQDGEWEDCGEEGGVEEEGIGDQPVSERDKTQAVHTRDTIMQEAGSEPASLGDGDSQAAGVEKLKIMALAALAEG